jgi:hypothetical protein
MALKPNMFFLAKASPFVPNTQSLVVELRFSDGLHISFPYVLDRAKSLSTYGGKELEEIRIEGQISAGVEISPIESLSIFSVSKFKLSQLLREAYEQNELGIPFKLKVNDIDYPEPSVDDTFFDRLAYGSATIDYGTVHLAELPIKGTVSSSSIFRGIASINNIHVSYKVKNGESRSWSTPVQRISEIDRTSEYWGSVLAIAALMALIIFCLRYLYFRVCIIRLANRTRRFYDSSWRYFISRIASFLSGISEFRVLIGPVVVLLLGLATVLIYEQIKLLPMWNMLPIAIINVSVFTLFSICQTVSAKNACAKSALSSQPGYSNFRNEKPEFHLPVLLLTLCLIAITYYVYFTSLIENFRGSIGRDEVYVFCILTLSCFYWALPRLARLSGYVLRPVVASAVRTCTFCITTADWLLTHDLGRALVISTIGFWLYFTIASAGMEAFPHTSVGTYLGVIGFVATVLWAKRLEPLIVIFLPKCGFVNPEVALSAYVVIATIGLTLVFLFTFFGLELVAIHLTTFVYFLLLAFVIRSLYEYRRESINKLVRMLFVQP